jgi:threonylcarbamoyladenosine tRNA methylthiotransferase MtaB
MASKYNTLFSGREEKILIEEAMDINGVTYQAGHNERYIKMAVKSNQDLINSIVKVKVAGFLKKDIMFCEIMD